MRQADELKAAPRETKDQLEAKQRKKEIQEMFDKGNNWTQGEPQSVQRERELRQHRESGRDVVVVSANA